MEAEVRHILQTALSHQPAAPENLASAIRARVRAPGRRRTGPAASLTHAHAAPIRLKRPR